MLIFSFFFSFFIIWPVTKEGMKILIWGPFSFLLVKLRIALLSFCGVIYHIRSSKNAKRVERSGEQEIAPVIHRRGFRAQTTLLLAISLWDTTLVFWLGVETAPRCTSSVPRGWSSEKCPKKRYRNDIVSTLNLHRLLGYFWLGHRRSSVQTVHSFAVREITLWLPIMSINGSTSASHLFPSNGNNYISTF